MLATSRGWNNARHNADGPAIVYDVRASSVVRSLDRRARLVPSEASACVGKPISRVGYRSPNVPRQVMSIVDVPHLSTMRPMTVPCPHTCIGRSQSKQ